MVRVLNLLIVLSMFLFSCATDANNDLVNNGDNSSSETSSSSSSSTHYISENSKGEYIADDWFLPYDKPKYRLNYGGAWKDKLQKQWDFYKYAMIDKFGEDLVVNNRKETNGGFYAAFSEGVAYGLIFSLYMNDQETFNRIWDAAEKKMRLSSGYFGWRYNVDDDEFTNPGDKTSATDGEEEICYALLCAAKLVEKGYWDEHKNPTNQSYKDRALEILDLMYNPDDEEGNTQIKFDYILPGDVKMWGWTFFSDASRIGVNPSYFMPGYLKELKKYKETNGGFDRVIDNSYELMKGFTAYDKGIAPDWCDYQGHQITSTARSLATQKEQYFMYLDAIRTPFRIGVDAVWNRDERAIEYCNNVANFINSPEKAGYYGIDGTLATLSNSDQTLNQDMYSIKWMSATFFDYTSDKAEEEYTTAGFPALAMWMGAILGSDNEDLKVEFAEKLKSCWVEDGEIPLDTKTMPRFGITNTAAGGGAHYFLQSLAMFGALMASGCYTNILEDLN